MPSVFISYNHHDADCAERVRTYLEKCGLAVTIDREAMQAGESIADFIMRCVRDDQVILSLVSLNSLSSSWVGQETELAFFAEQMFNEKHFLPVVIDGCTERQMLVEEIAKRLEKDLDHINNRREERRKSKLGSEDLNETESRILQLRNNLADIVSHLRRVLTLSIAGDDFERNMPKVVAAIKKEQQLPVNVPDAGEHDIEDIQVEDLIEYWQLDKAMDKFREFIELIHEEQKKFEDLQTQYSEINKGNIGEKPSPAVIEDKRKQVRSRFTRIVRALEIEIPKFLQVVDLPVITHMITDQKQILGMAIREILHDYYGDITFLDYGHSGWYFRAKKKGTQKDVVVKVLKITKTAHLPGKDEINQICNFKSGNIIGIDYYNFDRLPAYVVLDYVHGITLDKALQMFGGFPLEDALDIMRQLVKAFDFIRQKKILHTNIRPSKIFLNEDGAPMISSLDIIKFDNDDLRTLTRYKEECQYLSQEVLDMTLDTSNIKAVERSDQFSLGLLFLEMIGGEPLFFDKTVSGIFSKRNEFFKSPSKCLKAALPNRNCTKLLEGVLKRMLAKNPKDRYPDLYTVLKDVDNISARLIYESPLLRSFYQCYSRNRNLTEVFYQKLFTILPEEAKSHFVSLKRQYMMLRFSVYVVFEIEQKEDYFKRILASDRHAPFRDVSFFNTFLYTLRDTVRELLGDDWDDETMLQPWNDKIQKTLAVVERYLHETGTRQTMND
ncbi:MAG TPA: TIR domain-containing protein [Saprospiraceae bacterium]|nr:TIR domain-containing protein [Saprospiraceae bacterium]